MFTLTDTNSQHILSNTLFDAAVVICSIETLDDSCEQTINRFPLMIVGNVGRTFTAQDSFSLPMSFAGHTNATYTYNAKSEEFIESGM